MGKTYSNRGKGAKRKKFYEEFEPEDQGRFRQCSRKRGVYESARIAQIHADEQMELYGGYLRPYKCEYCKKYHLTHHPE